MLAGGITLSWNIGALYTRKNDLAKLELDRQKISISRETFLFNNAQQSRLSIGQTESLKQQIGKDDELRLCRFARRSYAFGAWLVQVTALPLRSSKIVSLRENIRNREENRLRNGLASVNDLLRSINAVSEARQTRVVHELQLLQEIYNLKYINVKSE